MSAQRWVFMSTGHVGVQYTREIIPSTCFVGYFCSRVPRYQTWIYWSYPGKYPDTRVNTRVYAQSIYPTEHTRKLPCWLSMKRQLAPSPSRSLVDNQTNPKKESPTTTVGYNGKIPPTPPPPPKNKISIPPLPPPPKKKLLAHENRRVILT